MKDLGTLGTNFSAANAINNAGWVVGFSSAKKANKRADVAPMHAFLYHNGKMTDLGTLGGEESAATSINDRGEIVGSSTLTGEKGEHAFLYRVGKMADLGTAGKKDSKAHDINNNGVVVGEFTHGGNLEGGDYSHAFLYKNGKIVDLNRLIPPRSSWILSCANAINDQGQIVGIGYFHKQARAFMLTPLAGK